LQTKSSLTFNTQSPEQNHVAHTSDIQLPVYAHQITY